MNSDSFFQWPPALRDLTLGHMEPCSLFQKSRNEIPLHYCYPKSVFCSSQKPLNPVLFQSKYLALPHTTSSANAFYCLPCFPPAKLCLFFQDELLKATFSVCFCTTRVCFPWECENRVWWEGCCVALNQARDGLSRVFTVELKTQSQSFRATAKGPHLGFFLSLQKHFLTSSLHGVRFWFLLLIE